MNPEEFFAGYPISYDFYEGVRQAIEAIGPAEIRVTKSQVAFWHRKPFARLWMPEQYLKREAAPLVLTLGFNLRNLSPRWKSVIEPAPGLFTHHLELYSAADIDDEVRQWLREAWEMAG